MSTDLIAAPIPASLSLEPTLNQSALELRELALSTAALIGKVDNAAENEAAVQAQKALKEFSRLVEKERVRLNEPALEYSRALMRLKEKSILEVEQEYGRISNLVADFQLRERRRIAEEQRKQQEELERIEREKQEALASATTPEQKAAIEEKAAEASYIESRPVASTRASGQRVTEDWEFTITNPIEFARCNPDCVNWEKLPVIAAQIKQHLNAGRTLKGLNAAKVVNSGVRTAGRRTIEV